MEQKMLKEIRIEEEKKVDITSKIIKPKRLSQEELTKKIAVRKEAWDRRGENSILIPEVSEWHKQEYADAIKEQHKTSQASKSWRRIVKEKDIPSLEEVQGNWNDWWKSDALVKITKKGIKREKKRKRNQKINGFLYVASGFKLLDSLNRKKKRQEEIDDIVQQFINKSALEAFRDNKNKSLRETLADFSFFIVKTEGCRCLMSVENALIMAEKYIQLNNTDEVDCLDVQILTDFYYYFRKKH